jgi:DNA-directed RNA polymerase specialized sigma24 family protein
MGANPSARDGQGPEIDQESLIRKVESLRTYLLFVAGRSKRLHSLPSRGVSDLVDSVLADAFEMIRNGEGQFTFQSDKKLRSWLVQRLLWTYLERLRQRHRHDQILRGLPSPLKPRTLSSEVALKEQAGRLAEARAMLDPSDRQLIGWRVDEDLTFDEIGRRRGYSTSYACRAYLKAMRRLGAFYRGIGGSDATSSRP